MFDLDAYFSRLGVRGQPDVADIHRSHVCSIPFENLDPHGGVPVLLDVEALQRKLVAGQRGGYCFEQNLLLKAALETLGAEVETMLARVRWGVPPGTVRPRAHLVLRVSIDGAVWLADVGFGAGTLLEPIPFGPGGPYEQSGWRFRVVEEGAELVLQTETDQQWSDVYAFAPQPVPPIDIEVSNWFTSTHPASAFVAGLIVSTQRPDGTRVSLSDWNELALVVRTPGASTATPVAREAIPRMLREHFGLPGFALTASGRVMVADLG
jgi:N-hydroxyarylamine O-acetyltransferase